MLRLSAVATVFSMRRSRWCNGFCLVALICLTGCNASPASSDDVFGCSLVACRDALTIVLRPPDGLFPPGEKRVTISTSSGSALCVFPAAGSNASMATCHGGMTGSIAPRIQCSSGSGDMGHCAPNASSYEMKLELASTPERIKLTYGADDGAVVQREVVPAYRMHRPNGAGCPPECTEATEIIAL
jgi:hypothetical protein